MTRIFVSYSRVDRRVAKTLVELLSHAYDHVWYDTARLVGGDEWWKEILQEIKTCDHFVFLLSPESVESNWCKKELDEAIRRNKHIIPVRVRERTEIPRMLNGLHCIDFFDLSLEGLNQIYAAVIRNSRLVAPPGKDRYRYADLRLLQRLWPLVNGEYFQRLEVDIFFDGVIEQSEIDDFENHVGKFLDLRHLPEYLFNDPDLEHLFVGWQEKLRKIRHQIALKNVTPAKTSGIFTDIVDEHRRIVKTLKRVYPEFNLIDCNIEEV